MATALRQFHHSVIAPTGRTIALGLRLNVLIWTKYFDIAWESTPLHEKLTWLMFLSHTLAIITLINFLAF